MTQDELLAQLAPIRVPLSFAEMTLRDTLLALCLGLIAGLVLAKLIGLLTTRTLKPVDRASAEIARLATADTDTRLTGLAKLLQHYNPQATQRLGISSALYDPAGFADPSDIEKAILDGAKTQKAGAQT